MVAVLVGLVVVGVALVASGARVAVPVSITYPEVAYTFGYGKNVVNVTWSTSAPGTPWARSRCSWSPRTGVAS